MFRETSAPIPSARPGVFALLAVFIVYAAVIIRTLARPDVRLWLPVYLCIELLCLVLFALMMWHPISSLLGRHLYFAFQTLLVLALLLLQPKFDFIVVLFVLLSFEAALVFPRRVRWLWVAVLILFTILPLTAALGLYGLALSLSPVTACIIFSAYVSVNQEIEAGLRASKNLLDELQATNRQLVAYGNQVEELSVIQEHNRLARELHDSVSQTIFSIILHERAARLLLDRDPGQMVTQLDQLKSLTRDSLEQMRGLIVSLRPPEPDSAERPTP